MSGTLMIRRLVVKACVDCRRTCASVCDAYLDVMAVLVGTVLS
jgi:hypothetical protein